MPAPQQREDYTANFQQELKKLNAAQKRAVDQVEGPVMVLAGPGTGKTHLLAARIGNILLHTDAQANNLLCLTYTEAGVRAMRERLISLIGPEAHRVNIYTFHGFCNLIIQDNLEYFGRPRLEALTDLERIRIIRTILDGLDVHHPLRLGKGNGYFYEAHLHWLFNTMKAENWSVDHLLERITEFIEGIPQNEDYRYKRKYQQHAKGDLKEAEVAKAKQQMTLLKAGVMLFPNYQKALAKAGRYDFADMIQWVLKAFGQFPLLLRIYQERYLYLLVDEFQDTNGAQNEIVRLLADYWDRPNVFIVGDDDQSIYEFQGARLQSMTDFYRRYTAVELVTLTENYRSGQAILDAATGLINRNELRIQNLLSQAATEKKLFAANPEYTTLPSNIQIQEFPDREQENAALLAQIQAWQALGYNYGDIAIIYARHKQVDQLQRLLEAAGMPFHSKRPTNILDELSIRQLRQLLNYFFKEQQQALSGEHLLYKMLHFGCFNLPSTDLAQLSIKMAGQREERISWRELLNNLSAATTPLKAVAQLKRVSEWLESCIASLGNLPLPRFIEKVLNGSGLLAWCSHKPDRSRQLAVMTTFVDFVRTEMVRRPRLDLEGLLTTLANMDENAIALPLRNQLAPLDAITLVTAHSAKGLEFECVWIVDANAKEWNGNRGAGNRRQFTLPPNLTLTQEADAVEAKRRLFFVSLTRARKELFISYAQLNESRKPQSPALFITELLENPQLSLKQSAISPDELLKLIPLRLGTVDTTPLAPTFEKAAIANLLANYRLSISGFNRYLDCPLSFLYETVLRVPQFTREQAVFGEALHQALQDYFLRMLAEPGRKFPGSAELIYYFELAMERRQAQFEPKQYQDRLLQGKRELAAYFEKYRNTWTTQVRVEQRIRDAEVNGVPLTGIIDRIDILSDTAVAIWDYKSGTHKQNRLKAPSRSQPHGGNYWRQLIFYKILYENRPGLNRKVTESGISFLMMDGAGEQPLAHVNITTDDINFLTTLIEDTWAKIQAQDFDGCGKATCQWCQFVKDNLTEIPTANPEIELLDES